MRPARSSFRLAAPALVLMLLCAPTIGAEVGPYHERVLTRLVATPTPLGPATALSDHASWRVDVPPGVFVVLDARSGEASPFQLRVHKAMAPEPAFGIPSSHHTWVLAGPGSWRVVADPTVGVGVDIRLTFRGYVSDVDGAPADFTLTDLGANLACVVPGVCLP